MHVRALVNLNVMWCGVVVENNSLGRRDHFIDQVGV